MKEFVTRKKSISLVSHGNFFRGNEIDVNYAWWKLKLKLIWAHAHLHIAGRWIEIPCDNRTDTSRANWHICHCHTCLVDFHIRRCLRIVPEVVNSRRQEMQMTGKGMKFWIQIDFHQQPVFFCILQRFQTHQSTECHSTRILCGSNKWLPCP